MIVSDPIVTLEPAELAVEPGGQTRTQLTVRNPGSVVEEYRLEVLGESPEYGPPAWAQVYPPELKVYPKESATATLVFAPPSAASSIASSGRFPYGVRAVSTVSADRSGVAEGELEVGRVFGLQASITPMTSSGRWRGYHLVKFTNWGNAPAHLRLRASDPDERLGFLLRPTELDLALGASAQARLAVRTRKPFLRGSPVRLPFEVVGEQDGVADQGPQQPMVSDPRRPAVNGALMQKPILSRLTVAVAAIAAVAVVGAIILALKQPKSTPTFESEGPPDPPIGLTAKPVADGKIQINWRPAHAVESYKLLTRQGDAVVGTTTVDGQQTRFVTTPLAPSTRYCFALESVRGKNASGDSTPACASTRAAPPSSGSGAPGSGSGSASGGAGGGPGGGTGGAGGSPSSSGGSSSGGTKVTAVKAGEWVVVFAIYPDTVKNARLRAAQSASVLSSSFAAQVLHSSDYPNWIWNGAKVTQPFWAVYVDTKTTDATNQMLQGPCRQLGYACVSTQPAGS